MAGRRLGEAMVLLTGATLLGLGIDEAGPGMTLAGGTVALLGLWSTLTRTGRSNRRAPSGRGAPAGRERLPVAQLRLARRDGALVLVASDNVATWRLAADGTLALAVRRAPGGALACRAVGRPVFFNTLTRSDAGVAVKLAGPLPDTIDLEVWPAALSRAA